MFNFSRKNPYYSELLYEPHQPQPWYLSGFSSTALKECVCVITGGDLLELPAPSETGEAPGELRKSGTALRS